MLVQACLAGNSAAFASLVDSYQAQVYNVALHITGSRDDAMDVTQSAFVKAYEKLHTFDLTRRFFSWLYRIAINEALNLKRRRGRESALPTDLVELAPDPETDISRPETTRLLHLPLRELTAQQRAVIVLKHLQGLSYREVAEVLGVPEKTVKSRLFSARRRLRGALRDVDVTP